ncbi:glycosyltransferase family 4 protein [Paenibacillus caui]|uniref:glycosyltransferase family 4 protein n=1 Tax=Paenibacillus caui TaxID=2873927 RepID=UPI001CAA3655|nr:glycosyltransferase family 4 protein [Paenibacillus caui]
MFTRKPHLRRRLHWLKRKGHLLKRRAGNKHVRAFEPRPLIHVPKLQLPEVNHYDPQLANRGTPERPLNILYLVHQFFPDSYTGTEKFVLNMAKAMLSKGHRVKVAAFSGRDPDTFPAADGNVVYHEYDYEGVPVVAYRPRHADPAQSFEIGNPDLTAFADKVIAQEQPDLIHIGHPMRAMEFMQASLGAGVPYMITLTDFWFACPKGIMLHTSGNLCAGPEQGAACLLHCQIPDVQQRLATHIPLLQSARKILSPSLFLASMMKYSLPDLQVEVLSHGINRDPALRNTKVYRRGDRLTLFYGGSLNDHKGVHLILEAMSQIKSNRLRLKIYGSGPAAYTEKLQQMAALDRRVELCGPYAESDLPQIYQHVDVAIVPSVWYENYPLALLEALSYNVPAIVSDAGGMKEKVQNGVNGYTFRLGDARHLAARIRALLANPALLNTFKSNMNTVLIPTIEQEAHAYESIYYSQVT